MYTSRYFKQQLLSFEQSLAGSMSCHETCGLGYILCTFQEVVNEI